MPPNPAFAEFLSRSRLSLDAVAASALAAQMWPTTLDEGEYLFHQGQPTDRFCMVYEGFCDVVSTSSDGKELVFTTLTAGDPIGEATILDGVPRTASIRAKSNATVLSIKRDAFLDLARANGDIALALARLSARTLRRLSSRIESSTFADLDTQLVALIVDLGVTSADGSITANVTQQALADRLGVTRESINKHLRSLADLDLVVLKRGAVSVPSLDAFHEGINR